MASMDNCLSHDAESLQGQDRLGPPTATISELTVTKVTGQEDVSLMKVLSPESELPQGEEGRAGWEFHGGGRACFLPM